MCVAQRGVSVKNNERVPCARQHGFHAMQQFRIVESKCPTLALVRVNDAVVSDHEEAPAAVRFVTQFNVHSVL